jgi:hypothetical protein
VIVAVVVVRMVQMSGHHVIGVVTVGDGLMSTTRAVCMVGLVVIAVVAGGTDSRILFAHLNRSWHPKLLSHRRSRLTQRTRWVTRLMLVNSPWLAADVFAMWKPCLV